MEPIKRPIKLAGLCTNFETKCYRTAQSFSYSRQFEIFWPLRDRGAKIKIGVLTLPKLEVYGNEVSYGQVTEHWFWELPTRKLMHNDSTREHPHLYPHDGDSFELPEIFNMDLDMDEGSLRFRIGEQDLGVAFRGLGGKELFLAFYTKGGVLTDSTVYTLHFD